jgi:hypothetical protein
MDKVKPITKEELDKIKGMLLDEVDQFAHYALPIFKHNDWQWALNGEMKVPELQDIKNMTINLINDLESFDNFGRIMSGRIVIYVIKDHYGDLNADMFVYSNWAEVEDIDWDNQPDIVETLNCPRCNSVLQEKQTDCFGIVNKCPNCGYTN